MIKVYVAEDESLARAALVEMCAAQPDLQVIGYADNGEQALNECMRLAPDVLFTDIRMPLLDGLELAAALHVAHPRTQLVFITAYDQYAVQAFRLAAVDYLLKPVADADFAACIGRIRRAMPRDAAHAAATPLFGTGPQWRQILVIRSVGRVDLVPLAEVTALRATGNYVEVLTRARTHLHRQTLKTLVEELDPLQFLQVHRSVIVGVRHMVALERDHGGLQIRLANGHRVPVSSRYRQVVEEWVERTERAFVG
jgi:DNA-binding LytR/AlgR family response regulator